MGPEEGHKRESQRHDGVYIPNVLSKSSTPTADFRRFSEVSQGKRAFLLFYLQKRWSQSSVLMSDSGMSSAMHRLHSNIRSSPFWSAPPEKRKSVAASTLLQRLDAATHCMGGGEWVDVVAKGVKGGQRGVMCG